MTKKKGKKTHVPKTKQRDVPRRTARKISKVQSKPAQPKKKVAGGTGRTSKTHHRIQKELPKKREVPRRKKPVSKRIRKPSELKEFLRDIDYKRKPKRARSILFDFPELDYLDDLEELLDDEQAEEAEEQGNSKEMWFAATHSTYKKIEEKAKKIAHRKTTKGKKHVTKIKTKEKPVTRKRARVEVHRSVSKHDSRRSKKHPAKRKSVTKRK